MADRSQKDATVFDGPPAVRSSPANRASHRRRRASASERVRLDLADQRAAALGAGQEAHPGAKSLGATRLMNVSTAPTENHEAVGKARSFLELVVGGVLSPERSVAIWTLPDKRTHLFADYREAARYAIERADDSDVYFCTCAVLSAVQRGRGKFEDMAGMIALRVEVDVSGPGHRATKLPADKQTALQELDLIEPKPAVIVDSGGGLHAYVLLEEPWIFQSDDDRQLAQTFIRRYWATIAAAFAQRGWHLDPAHDLTRVLRVPGTMNRKDPGNLRPVKLLRLDPTLRYTRDQIDKLLLSAPTNDDWKSHVPDSSTARAKVKSSGRSPGGVGYPSPSGDLIRELCAYSPTFEATWNLRRCEFTKTDGTPDWSRYDQAVASAMAASLFDPDDNNGQLFDQIAGAIQAFRDRNCTRQADRDKARRSDYIAQTVGKALAWAARKNDSTRVQPSRVAASSNTDAREHRRARYEVPRHQYNPIPGPCGLALRLAGPPRRTPTRTTAPFEVLLKEKCVALLRISDTPTGIANAARLIRDHLQDDDIDMSEVRRFVAAALADAHAVEPAARAGDSMALDIVMAAVGSRFDLRYRDNRGQAWSEALGRWIRRAEFTAYTPRALLDQLRREVQELQLADEKLAPIVNKLLGVAWATICEKLPREEDVDGLDPKTRAAAEFRRTMVRLWTTLTTFELATTDIATAQTSVTAARASLVSRARHRFEDCKVGGGWTPVQSAFDAWSRSEPTGEMGSAGGRQERVPWLSMRYTLMDQMRVKLLPGRNPLHNYSRATSERESPQLVAEAWFSDVGRKRPIGRATRARCHPRVARSRFLLTTGLVFPNWNHSKLLVNSARAPACSDRCSEIVSWPMLKASRPQ